MCSFVFFNSRVLFKKAITTMITTYKNKLVLLIGGTRLINEAVVGYFLEQGVGGQVRATVVMKKG